MKKPISPKKAVKKKADDKDTFLPKVVKSWYGRAVFGGAVAAERPLLPTFRLLKVTFHRRHQSVHQLGAPV